MNRFSKKQKVDFSSILFFTDSTDLGKTFALTCLKLLNDFENLTEQLLLRICHGTWVALDSPPSPPATATIRLLRETEYPRRKTYSHKFMWGTAAAEEGGCRYETRENGV